MMQNQSHNALKRDFELHLLINWKFGQNFCVMSVPFTFSSGRLTELPSRMWLSLPGKNTFCTFRLLCLSLFHERPSQCFLNFSAKSNLLVSLALVTFFLFCKAGPYLLLFIHLTDIQALLLYQTLLLALSYGSEQNRQGLKNVISWNLHHVQRKTIKTQK